MDTVKRLSFVRKIHGLYKNIEGGSTILWTEQINMYIDGVGFEYKRNPYELSKTPTAREWRLQNEGLRRGCTTKGKKEGSTQVKFMVGISYKRGIVLCEPITERMNAKYFANMIREKFPTSLGPGTKTNELMRILQDGDPTQNSKKAMQAFVSIGTTIFSIPPRSPDLNPIENLFNSIRRNLREEAHNKRITEESMEEFTARVVHTLKLYDPQKVDDIIDSMPKRLKLIEKVRGQRIKY